MAKKSSRNGNQPLTISEFKRVMKGIDKQFVGIYKRFIDTDKRFAQIDRNFAALNGKLAAFIAVNSLNIDRAINALEERQNKKFDAILAKMDEFLKRTDKNEREIGFLGKQHDDLAKYCHEKINYPVYGRSF